MSKTAVAEECARCEQVHERCSAHRTDGDPCGMQPMRGMSVCRRHGGSSKKAKAAAERRIKEQEVRELGEALGTPVELNPVDALLSLIYSSAGHVEYYRQQVTDIAEVDPDNLVWGQTGYTNKTGGEDWGTTHVEKAEINVWLKLYNEERDRLAAYCSKAISLGIEERRVRLAETQGHQVAEAIRLVLTDMYKRLVREYDLDEEAPDLWKGWMQQVVPARLRAIAE